MVDVDVASLGVPMGGNGYGYGYGCGGFGGGGFGAGFVGGLFGGALTRGFRGRGDDCDDGISPSLAYLTGRDNGLQAKTSDVVASTASLTQTVIDGAKENADVTRNTGGLIMGGIGELRSGQFALSRELCDVKHSSDMQFASLSAQAERLACEGKMTTMAETNKILEALNAQNMARMEDKLEATRFQLNNVQRERDLLATGNFPISQPAHVEKHHCHSREDGVDIRINAIGNEVNGLKFQNQQILQALNGIANAGQGAA